jgi:hypothetical protein
MASTLAALTARFTAGFFAAGFFTAVLAAGLATDLTAAFALVAVLGFAIGFFAAVLTVAFFGAASGFAAGFFTVIFFGAAFALLTVFFVFGAVFFGAPVDFFVAAIILLLDDQKSPSSDQGRRGLRGTTLLASIGIDAACERAIGRTRCGLLIHVHSQSVVLKTQIRVPKPTGEFDLSVPQRCARLAPLLLALWRMAYYSGFTLNV